MSCIYLDKLRDLIFIVNNIFMKIRQMYEQNSINLFRFTILFHFFFFSLHNITHLIVIVYWKCYEIPNNGYITYINEWKINVSEEINQT